MATACALVGALAGAFVATVGAGSGYGVFALAAPGAGLLGGAAAWWLIVSRAGRHTRWRGACAGALAAVLGHYLCWVFVMLSASAEQASRGTPILAGQVMLPPLDTLAWAAVPALWSLLILGWVTVPVGALLGVLIAARQKLKGP